MGYGEVNTDDADAAGLFALPALFITFRETLEAAIIVSVLLGLLDKLERPELKKHVWYGVVIASILCTAAMIIILVVIHVLKSEFLDAEGQILAEGILSIVAAILIGYVALSMGNMYAKYEKFTNRLGAQVAQEGDSDTISSRTIFFLSFTAVVREGMETIIFFTGIGALYPPESLPIPAVVGAVIGVLIGLLLYKFGGRLTLVWFFRFTMVLLVFIGAGIFTVGMHYLQELGRFGTWEPEEARSAMNQYLWDIRECCGYDVSQGWIMFRVLFGYTPVPTGFEALFYLSYHFVVWSCVVFRYQNQKRRDEGKKPFQQVFRESITKCKCRNGASNEESATTVDPLRKNSNDSDSQEIEGLSADLETLKNDPQDPVDLEKEEDTVKEPDVVVM